MPNVRYVDCSSIDVIHSLKASMNGINLLIQNKDIALQYSIQNRSFEAMPDQIQYDRIFQAESISKDSSYLISISGLIK